MKANIGNLNNKSDLENKKLFFLNNISRFCDKCGTMYRTDDLEIVQETSTSSIIHFTCTKCKSSHIASYFKPLSVSTKMPINTDLMSKEFSRFSHLEQISADDILDLYNDFEKTSTVKL